MQKSLSGFRATLLVGWIALSAAGIVYARLKNIPVWAAVPILAAFLIEFPFYLVPGFAPMREQLLERVSKHRLRILLVLSALLPYLVYSLPTGQFRWSALALLAGVASVLSTAPPVVLVPLAVAVMLGRVFESIYTSPVPGLDLRVLGQLMLIRAGATSVLVLGGLEVPGYGFVPSRRDWRTGIAHFLLFVAVGFPLAWKLGVLQFHTVPVWKVAGTFIAFLWVVALGEEFLFRGLLQRWLADWSGKRTLALVITSVLFGLAHLPLRGFPNWRFAAIATVLGLFCGRAFHEAGSIGAAIVTHALVVTLWRSFF